MKFSILVVVMAKTSHKFRLSMMGRRNTIKELLLLQRTMNCPLDALTLIAAFQKVVFLSETVLIKL